ncbi:MAG: hypothetical protein HXY37_11400 [Chloroflexi bacterium]|nr:hypothetical protein [Chloroflexota bacterium]
MTVTSKVIGGKGAHRLGWPASFGPLAYLVTAVLAVLASYVLVNALIGWAQVRLDDLRYGRPRTSHVAGYVGHPAEGPGRPTRLVGMNIDRQVVVLELPGGDATQVRSLPGPYLFGAREDLTPVVLSLRDMDGDGRDDLIIDVRNEHVVYLNREQGFRLPTPDEQTLLVQEHHP